MDKPRFIVEAEKFLAGEKLANYLAFSDFLKDNKASKSATSQPTSQYSGWSVRYKKRTICHFRAWHDFWYVSFFKNVDVNLYEPFLTVEMRNFILDNIATELPCGGCSGNSDRVILGRKFDIVCGCHLLRLNNPSCEMLERAKELVLLTKAVVES